MVRRPARLAQGECTFGQVRDREAVVPVEMPVTASGKGNVQDRTAENQIPRRGIVDNYILDELDRRGISAAPLAGDDEFLRRVYLDLAGRVPNYAEITGFLSDCSPEKRTRLIDRLLDSPDFDQRWTLFFDDLFQVTASLSNVYRDVPGTLAYHIWVRDAVRGHKPLTQMARELLTGAGNNFDALTAASNHVVNGYVDNGPEQDFFDKLAVNAMRTFHGNRNFDCIGCHNGRGHAEGVSLWAASRTRMQFWQIAAFFSRTQIESPDVPMADPYYNSFLISDKQDGSYLLNTIYGNRPARRPVGSTQDVTPIYFNGATPQGDNWRTSFADFVVNDRLFALSFANRLFGQMFGVALVPAVDGLDPDRLDPSNPPEAPWKLQASHPELLVQLGRELANANYQIRPFLRLLATSSVYQLSSRYDGNWKPTDGTLYERHYVKRMEPEFLADAIADVTGVPGDYQVEGLPGPLRAVQLPDIYEPQSDSFAFDMMYPFARGNRDNQKRNQSFSVSQQLRLMNGPFLLYRLVASPVLAQMAKIPVSDAVVDELYLRILARHASASERAQSLESVAWAQTEEERFAALGELALAVLNQPDFLLIQ